MNKSLEYRFIAGAKSLNNIFNKYRCLVGKSCSQYNEKKNNKEFSFILNTQVNKNGQIEWYPNYSATYSMHHLVTEW
jgi:hypothetical protein